MGSPASHLLAITGEYATFRRVSLQWMRWVGRRNPHCPQLAAERRFGCFRDLRESCVVANCEVGEDLAIDLHLCPAEAVDELRVAEAV